MTKARWGGQGFLVLLVLWLGVGSAGGYSVQTHEQLIDLAWKGSIVPLLKARFPAISEAQLAEAHGYAYGGCAIQDIGYYPFGNDLFSDLTHYVRSGDFIATLLRDARTPDEVAFAVGALSHYIGDSIGHSVAVNPAVATEFPELERRFGRSVSYEDGPRDHVRTEFAFDVNEIAKHRFAPSRYQEHYGFGVAIDLLTRAFYETYGLPLDRILRVQRTQVFGYRFTARHLIPGIANAEALLHGRSFPPDVRDAEFVKLEQELAQSGAENKWPPYRRKPGLGTHVLAGLIVILPKVGVLSELAIKGPTAATEESYVRSVNQSATRLRQELARLAQPSIPVADAAAVHVRQSDLPNRDLDTGGRVKPGGYRLADQTYARLLAKVTKHPLRGVPAGLQEDLLAYYADPAAPISTRQHRRAWARVQTQLATLTRMQAIPGI